MKKLKSIIALVALFAIVLTVAACTNTANAEETYVTIDINPSVELIVNGNEKVVYANALNEDAEVLLAELDLIGMDVEAATDLIIETAIALGYIDVDAVDTLVEVSSMSDTALGEKIRQRVKEAVNNAFQNRGLNGHSEDKGFDPEFIAEAESYDVTPGFLFLAQSVMAVQDDITLEDALLMTQDELRDILKDARAEARDVLTELRDEFFAERDDIRAEYQPQIESLQTNIVDIEAQIAALQAQIDVESTEALVEQLETLQATLVDNQDQLQALRDSMHDELALLRDDFHAQSEALYPEIMAVAQQRRQQAMTRLQQWMENHPESSFAQRIQEWRDNQQQGNGNNTDDAS